MYIEKTISGYDGTEQISRRANFLLLIQPATYERINDPIKALVRKVALRQCGNFMMGRAKIYGKSIIISGSYGGDGLPVSVPDEIYDRARVVVPEELVKAWNEGGGWNSAGKEASLMRKWANENLERLRK